MLITKIEKQKKRENRYSVFIDNEFSFGIDEVDLLYYKLKENQEIDKKTYEYIINNLVFNKARDKAIRYLSYKMRSEYQVIKKLEEDDFSPDIINKVINLLKKYNYINDYEFAKAFFKDKMTLSKHGSIKIREDLRLSGIKSDIIDKVIYENDIDEAEIAFELLAKKTIRRTEKSITYKEKQKLISYLLRRGFSYDITKIAYERFLLEEDFLEV